MSFWHIFPVFYEFFPYFSSYLSILKFLHNLMLIIEKFSETLLRLILCKKWKNFRHFEPFEMCHEDFHRCWHEKKGKKLAYFGFKRKKNWKFWAKYLPLHFNYIEQQQKFAVSLTCHRPYFLTVSLHEWQLEQVKGFEYNSIGDTLTLLLGC